jgi:hypothetical protein
MENTELIIASIGGGLVTTLMCAIVSWNGFTPIFKKPENRGKGICFCASLIGLMTLIYFFVVSSYYQEHKETIRSLSQIVSAGWFAVIGVASLYDIDEMFDKKTN